MLSDDLKSELEEICDDNKLTIDFDFEYPIKITIRKSMQVNMLEEPPKEAYLRFKFIIDQIDFDFIGGFKIDDKLFGKLLTKVKKLHYIYLQEQYSQKARRYKSYVKPLWETSNGCYVALVNKNYKG